MAIIHAKPTPIQLRINAIAFEAMSRMAAARGVTLTLYASQLLEAAWSARVKPTGDDLALEAAVSRGPVHSHRSAAKLIERINDAETRLRAAEAENVRLNGRLAAADGREAEAEKTIRDLRKRLDAYDDDLRAALQEASDARAVVATVRGEVSAVGDKILDKERWRLAFERSRRRLARMATKPVAEPIVRHIAEAIAAQKKADLLPASIVKGVRSMLAIGNSIAEVAAQYDLAPDVVKALKK